MESAEFPKLRGFRYSTQEIMRKIIPPDSNKKIMLEMILPNDSIPMKNEEIEKILKEIQELLKRKEILEKEIIENTNNTKKLINDEINNELVKISVNNLQKLNILNEEKEEITEKLNIANKLTDKKENQ